MEEKNKQHKKERNYQWKKMHPNYQQEWRDRNSNKVKEYLIKDKK